MNLAQSILQSFQLKKTLNPDIWTLDKDDRYVLRSEIRDKLLLVANDFLEFVDIGPLDCDVVSKECTIEDVTITGSICNFNWSKFSDIDLHLVVDYDEVDENEELVNNILMTKKNLWNASHNVSIKNYEVEVYVQNSEELHFSSGVYSVLFNKWLIAPKKVNVKLDINKVLKKATGWMELIDSLQSRAYGMSPEEIIEVINRIKEKLKRFRMCGLEKGGEFSYENLAFKFLRRSGYIKKLFDLKNKVVDLSLSLD
jgi:hypothetical protein